MIKNLKNENIMSDITSLLKEKPEIQKINEANTSNIGLKLFNELKVEYGIIL